MGLSQPGPFVVRYDRTELQLQPFTYCVSNGCADGFDDDPPSVGSPDELLVFVPVREFDQLHVGQVERLGTRASDAAWRRKSLNSASGWWSVRPRGPAAEYVVDLFASGEGAGDMIASLRWTTPTDEPLPDPTATLTAVVDHDGAAGLLRSRARDRQPGRVARRVLRDDHRDRVERTGAHLPGGRERRVPVEGSLYFDEPDAEAKRASTLGDFPFTYAGRARTRRQSRMSPRRSYPDDLVDDRDVSVPLQFEPGLP